MSRVACGLSTATNSTLESINAAMNAKLRERRSSLAMTELSLAFAAKGQRPLKLRAIIAFAGLDFRKFGNRH